MRPNQKVCSRQPPHPNRISRNLYINLPQQAHAATKTKPLLLQRNQAYQYDTSEFIDQQTTHRKINTSTYHIGTKQDPSKPWGRPHNSTNRQRRYPPWGRHHQTNRYNNPHQASRGRKSNTHHLPQQPASIQLIHQRTETTLYTYYAQPADNSHHYQTTMMTRVDHQITNRPHLQPQLQDKCKNTTGTQHLHSHCPNPTLKPTKPNQKIIETAPTRQKI